MKIERVFRKTLDIKFSGRSTDFLSPSIIYECGFNCLYCYVKRHNQKSITIATNLNEILTEINSHAMFSVIEKPNQTHEQFITYDIGCNTDIALHAKHHDWKRIFEFFKEHPIAFGSFATKFVNRTLLTYNPERKVRIRFSLMPQKYSTILEPNTSKIIPRIQAINDFIKAGYDVHINFSPVIVTKDWLKEYEILFKNVDLLVNSANKNKVKAEVIFLTHNVGKHEYNVLHNLPGEDLIWNPDIQESKISQYGGKNLRYALKLKDKYIKDFKQLHSEIIPWNTIRYIF